MSADEIRDRLQQILRVADAAGVPGSSLLRVSVTDPQSETAGPGYVVETEIRTGLHDRHTVRSWTTLLTVTELRQLTEAVRLAENERYRIWEEGFRGGLRALDRDPPPGDPYPRNPYEHHGADAT